MSENYWVGFVSKYDSFKSELLAKLEVTIDNSMLLKLHYKLHRKIENLETLITK